MKKQYLITFIIFLTAILVLFSLLHLNQSTNSKENGFKTISVKASGIQTEIDRTVYFYKYSKQNMKNYPSLNSDAKNRVIEAAIIKDYANKNQITASWEEINERYNQKIKQGGEQNLLQQLHQMYGMSKNDYLEVLKQDILRDKVQKYVGMPISVWLKEQKKELKVIIQ